MGIEEIDDERRMEIRALLEEISKRELPTVDQLVRAMKSRMVEMGVVDHPGKIDRVYVGRDLLGALLRSEPPLVTESFHPADVDELEHVASSAQRRYTLTPAGLDFIRNS